MINLNKKERLVESASVLFHRNGLAATSLADIAKHADIPIGNVYYYFKTKEELALAVVEKYREQFSGAYAALNDAFDDPRQRLIEMVRFYEKVKDDYTRYGCPIGKIVNDTDTQRSNIGKAAAEAVNDFIEWAWSQFRQLGHADEGRQLAHTLAAAIQGAIGIAKATGNPQIMDDEIARLAGWLEAVPNKKIRAGKIAAPA